MAALEIPKLDSKEKIPPSFNFGSQCQNFTLNIAPINWPFFHGPISAGMCLRWQTVVETHLDVLELRSLSMICHGSASYSLEEKMHAAGLEQMAQLFMDT